MKNNLKSFTFKFPSKLFSLLIPIVIALGVFLGFKVLYKPSVNHLNRISIIGLPKSPNVGFIPIRNEKSKDPIIFARYYGLMDVDSGTFLLGSHQDDKIPIASIAKIMTSVIAVENFKMDDVIEISQESANTIGSTMQLESGEKITVLSLLNGLLIPSGNDAAYTFAEYYGKSIKPTANRQEAIDIFVAKMNERAKELGLQNTHYLDPAGLNDDAKSTARDQGILIAYALRNQTIVQIIHKPNAIVTSVDGSITHKLDNSDRLVKEEMLYPGIIGGKTGFTPAAGHNLVTAAERNGHRLIAIIFNTFDTSAPASAIEARKILDWGFNNYSWEKI